MPALALAAVILDMDGLMIDSEVVERRAWMAAAAEHACSLSADDFLLLLGRNLTSIRQILTELWRARGEPAQRFDDVVRRKIELAATEPVVAKPGLTELLDWARAAGLPVAVASSSPRQIVQRRLAAIGVLDRVEALVGGDEVARGKPEPDIFLAAAARLGADPARTVVAEDSDSGVRAAHAAGMITVLVPDASVPRVIPVEILALATHRCASLADIPALLS